MNCVLSVAFAVITATAPRIGKSLKQISWKTDSVRVL